MKSKKPLFKLIFYEKSYHKSNFLKEMSKKFNLNSEIRCKNIFDEKNLIYRRNYFTSFQTFTNYFQNSTKKF